MSLKKQLAALRPGERLWTHQQRGTVNATTTWLLYSGQPRLKFRTEKDPVKGGHWVTCIAVLPDL